MRRPANHSHVCRKMARQCLAPMNNHLKFVGATHASPCKPQLRMSKEGEAMPRPYEQSPQIRRGDACVTLQTTATYVERGRGMPRPYEQSPQIRRGDACVALQTTATHVERGRGNASPLANNHLKFVGATHASPCKPQPRMSKEGASLPRSYEHHDFVKP